MTKDPALQLYESRIRQKRLTMLVMTVLLLAASVYSMMRVA